MPAAQGTPHERERGTQAHRDPTHGTPGRGPRRRWAPLRAARTCRIARLPRGGYRGGVGLLGRPALGAAKLHFAKGAATPSATGHTPPRAGVRRRGTSRSPVGRPSGDAGEVQRRAEQIGQFARLSEHRKERLVVVGLEGVEIQERSKALQIARAQDLKTGLGELAAVVRGADRAAPCRRGALLSAGLGHGPGMACLGVV